MEELGTYSCSLSIRYPEDNISPKKTITSGRNLLANPQFFRRVRWYRWYRTASRALRKLLGRNHTRASSITRTWDARDPYEMTVRVMQLRRAWRHDEIGTRPHPNKRSIRPAAVPQTVVEAQILEPDHQKYPYDLQ